MKKIFEILTRKPELYEQTSRNIWDDPYISKRMLEAHLDTSLDSATRNREFVKRSVEWIAHIVPATKYPNLLDLGCGPGIYAEMFKEQGYCVEGIDLSKNSIAYARKSALEKGLTIEYILGDYLKHPFTRKYNLITLIYCDFGVLSPNDRKVLLKKVYNTLHHNGVLIFDVFTPLKYKNESEDNSWEINENGFWHEKLCLTLKSFYRYDDENTYLNRYTVVTEDEEIFVYNVWEHTFTSKELKDDLEHAGFKNIRFFGDVAGAMCSESDYTICVVAEK